MIDALPESWQSPTLGPYCPDDVKYDVVAEMTAINRNRGTPSAIKLVRRRGYNRLPVYSGNIGNVIGVVTLTVWDLMEGEHSDRTLAELTRKPLYVSPLQKIHELLPLHHAAACGMRRAHGDDVQLQPRANIGARAAEPRCQDDARQRRHKPRQREDDQLDAGNRDARIARGVFIVADRIQVAPEGRLVQHQPEHDGQSEEQHAGTSRRLYQAPRQSSQYVGTGLWDAGIPLVAG